VQNKYCMYMKKEKENDNQQPSFLYSRCIPDWRPALNARKKIMHFKKGETIFNEGDLVPGVYFMIEGIVKVHKHWGNSKELILRFALEQDIIGHRGLSTHSKVYPVSATALSKVKVCFIDLGFFHSTLKVNPEFMFDFMMFFADELQLSEQKMRDLVHMPLRKRTANTLLTLSNQFGTNTDGYINFPINRQDIASYIGSAYETVHKLLAEFTREGWIKSDGKAIAVLDRNQLESVD
jgi:CRP-like cAMP-binding protein